MASQKSDSNELLKFMNTATSSLQEALGRSTKTKKVNHRRYIEKQLQKGPSRVTTKKSKPSTTNNVVCGGRQPVAPPSIVNRHTCNITGRDLSQFIAAQNEYDQLYELVSRPSPLLPPSTTTANSFDYYSRPPSAHQELYDPEIESLLSELVDSPSCSLYGDYSSPNSGSARAHSTLTSMDSCPTTACTADFNVLSPPSDFSDFDESAYSSPQTLSPVNINYTNVSPPPNMYYQHNLSATYDCYPTDSPLAVTHVVPPNTLSLQPYNQSITELIAELVSTP